MTGCAPRPTNLAALGVRIIDMTHSVQQRRVSKSAAALLGPLSALAALAAGHLVAGLLAPFSSPYLAVGNTAIDFTPRAVKTIAIELFGTADKVALLIGMAIVIGLVAIAAGLASRRRAAPGLIVIAVFGLLGVAAVLGRPGSGPLELTAPAVAAVVGLGVFASLHASARRGSAPRREDSADEGAVADEGSDAADAAELVDDSTAQQRPSTRDRRRFLITSTAVAAASGIAGIGGQGLADQGRMRRSRAALGRITADSPPSRIPSGADFAKSGTPSFITPNEEFYRIDTALRVPRIAADRWRLRIHGMVDRELELSFEELRDRRLVEKPITLACVSNPVGGDYISTSRFTGVPIRDLLDEVGVRPGAEQVFSTSADGFTAGTPVEALTDPNRDALLAIAMNGEPLPAEHGFPVRMVTPGLYGFVSATKWVTDLELTSWDKQPYWRERGWARRAPIKTQSRIDRPGGFAKIPAGKVTIAGTAWAQHVGIERVEVRVDNGPWQRAELASAVNVDTWRMWRIEVSVPPGGHNVECRATDKSGYTQTAKRVPTIPDGATGRHSVFFTAQ